MCKTKMTAKDYRNEHDDLTVRLSALESRIGMRLLTLCKQNPDVPIARKADNMHDYLGGTIIVAKSIANASYIKDLSIDAQIKLIETIEKFLADKNPVKQLSINF